MLSGCPVGENWIISSNSDREASGASATLWLGMRVMALLSRRAVARGQGTVTGKDGTAAGSVTGDRAVPCRSPARAVPRAGRTVSRASRTAPWPGAVTIRPAGSSFPAEPWLRQSHAALRKDLAWLRKDLAWLRKDL